MTIAAATEKEAGGGVGEGEQVPSRREIAIMSRTNISRCGRAAPVDEGVGGGITRVIAVTISSKRSHGCP